MKPRSGLRDGDAGTVRFFRLLGIAIGIAAALLGAVVIICGWGLGIESLKSVMPGLSTMKVNTALGIAALGAGLALRAGLRGGFAAARMAAGVALAIALMSLVEYGFHWQAGIDEVLFLDPATPRTEFPGRPAVATALMIALLATAQLCGRGRPSQLLKTATALAASLIAWAALSGYVFGPEALRAVPPFSSVAVHTAAVILLLGIGTLASEPISWPVRTIMQGGTAGTVCRWLLPPAILAPPLLGWFLSHARAIGLYPEPFRWALYCVASSLGSTWLIVVLAHRIALIDAERNLATQISLRDPLTGLANRRAFDSFLMEAFNLAKRHNRALSLALLDIDRFKAYNDEYGHPAGDDLLRLIGVLLCAVARETDLVARIGGEEFAIALPETDLAGAMAIGERIRAAVERSSTFRRTVTVSVGVAFATEKIADVSMLIEACDSALYRSKSSGRNRVSAHREILDARAS
jgi:diguanylate cyclase (GGDEF)-like protein